MDWFYQHRCRLKTVMATSFASNDKRDQAYAGNYAFLWIAFHFATPLNNSKLQVDDKKVRMAWYFMICFISCMPLSKCVCVTHFHHQCKFSINSLGFIFLIFSTLVQFSLMYLQATRNMQHATCQQHAKLLRKTKMKLKIASWNMVEIYANTAESSFIFSSMKLFLILRLMTATDSVCWPPYFMHNMQRNYLFLLLLLLYMLMKCESERKQSADKISIYTCIDK